MKIHRDIENNEPLTAVWQKWRFSAPQTHLWLIKQWFSASTFVVKIATFAKPQTVGSHSEMKYSEISNRWMIEIIWVIENLFLSLKQLYDLSGIQCEPCLENQYRPPCQTDYMANF